MRKMKYETKFKLVCITPCMIRDNLDGNRPMIGSAQCHKCSNFISQDCKKKIVTCKGHIIYRKSREKPIVLVKNYMRPVWCLENGKTYTSVKEASVETGLSTTSVTNSCRKGVTTKKGLTFKYINEPK